MIICSNILKIKLVLKIRNSSKKLENFPHYICEYIRFMNS